MLSLTPSHNLCFQLEAFYSIFTTEQQDHVKSVDYLRNNFRPKQRLNGRVVYKSAVKDAWNQDMNDDLDNTFGTEASKGSLFHMLERDFRFLLFWN